MAHSRAEFFAKVCLFVQNSVKSHGTQHLNLFICYISLCQFSIKGHSSYAREESINKWQKQTKVKTKDPINLNA